MNPAARTIALAALCAVIVLAWTFGSPAKSESVRLQPLRVSESMAAPVPDPVPARTQSEAPRTADPVARFLQTGWLRGTDVDGSWGVWRGGQLQPSIALRRRFDYLLSSIGDVSTADMRRWLAQQATADLGADGANAVLAVWDAYVALRQAGGDRAMDLDNAQSWQRAIDERTARRQAALGPAWAYAFFSAEDQQLLAQLQRRLDAQSGKSVAVADEQMDLIATPDQPLTEEQSRQRDARRVSVFGVEAAQRMHAQDETDAQFRERLAAARQRAAAISSDPQLSELQRDQQQAADLAQSFSGNELVRAKALLSVSSTGS